MTPKEKAEELVDKYKRFVYCYSGSGMLINQVDESIILINAKQCALIAVDEIINNNSKIPGLLTQDTMHNTWFWKEVKQEIEKL